jgi:hypothetical protein
VGLLVGKRNVCAALPLRRLILGSRLTEVKRMNGTGVNAFLILLATALSPATIAFVEGVTVSWSAQGTVQNLATVPSHAAIHISVPGVTSAEDCDFAFGWTGDSPDVSRRVRIGWRSSERPNNSWLYAKRGAERIVEKAVMLR